MAVYDRDPTHLWNRLHETLFVREGPDGVRYGVDRLDPLLWGTTNYPLAGDTHRRVLALLDEFLAQPDSASQREPLSRAFLQHDLWVMFDWTFEPRTPDPFEKEREALRWRLASVMRRLALSSAEIAALPDNYSEATGSMLVPGLPAGLTAVAGDWVLVGRDDRSAVAPLHMSEFGGRSTFEVRLSLPGGREVAVAYLAELREAVARIAVPIRMPAAPGMQLTLPALPQFPIGARWALMRRLCVLGTDGQPHATRFVESIQLRRYLLSGPAEPRDFDREQEVMEFVAHRDWRGTLRAVHPTERGFLFVQFRSMGVDLFELPERSDWAHEPFGRRAQRAVLQQCRSCHGAPPGGIYSVASEFPMLFAAEPRFASLIESGDEQEFAATLQWKRAQPDFERLQQLWHARRQGSVPARR